MPASIPSMLQLPISHACTTPTSAPPQVPLPYPQRPDRFASYLVAVRTQDLIPSPSQQISASNSTARAGPSRIQSHHLPISPLTLATLRYTCPVSLSAYVQVPTTSYRHELALAALTVQFDQRKLQPGFFVRCDSGPPSHTETQTKDSQD